MEGLRCISTVLVRRRRKLTRYREIFLQADQLGIVRGVEKSLPSATSTMQISFFPGQRYKYDCLLCSASACLTFETESSAIVTLYLFEIAKLTR